MTAGTAAAPSILVYGDPRLRLTARAVTPDEDLGDLPTRLLTGMQEHDGIGLAAPQLGEPSRVIAVVDPQGKPRKPLVMVNPEIVEAFGPVVTFEEGCLSFPGLYFDVLRPLGVEVSYRDPDGNERILRDEGLLARVIQHEVDHLDGILYIDRLPRWRRWLLARRLRRIRAHHGRGQA